MKLKKTLTTLALVVLFSGIAYAGYNHDVMNPEYTQAIAASALPAGCKLLADDTTNGRPIFIDCDSVAGLSDTGTLQAVTTSGVTTGTLTTTGAITVDTVAVNRKALSLPGRATIKICGDATTVNNNTVYYGPSMVVAAGGHRTCDIAAAGNTTEATADEPAFTNTAFQVLSWHCLQPDANANLTYTLRSAGAALTPANAITINDNALSGSSTTGTTTAIASGATFAIAVSSTSDVGTAQFVCEINVAY